jgi:hypothetical protein
MPGTPQNLKLKIWNKQLETNVDFQDETSILTYTVPSVESLYRAGDISSVQFWCFLYCIFKYYIFEISPVQFPNFPVGYCTL